MHQGVSMETGAKGEKSVAVESGEDRWVMEQKPSILDV